MLFSCADAAIKASVTDVSVLELSERRVADSGMQKVLEVHASGYNLRLASLRDW